MNEIVNKIKEKLSGVKHKEILLIAILAIILLLFFVGDCSSKTDAGKSMADKAAGTSYCEKMTDDVTDAVKLMTGSNACKVIINWSDGGENIIAYTTSSTGSGQTKTPEIITVNGKSTPVILKEQYPIAVSVAIICPKNTAIQTKLDLKYMIVTLLGADFDKVAIYSC